MREQIIWKWIPDRKDTQDDLHNYSSPQCLEDIKATGHLCWHRHCLTVSPHEHHPRKTKQWLKQARSYISERERGWRPGGICGDVAGDEREEEAAETGGWRRASRRMVWPTSASLRTCRTPTLLLIALSLSPHHPCIASFATFPHPHCKTWLHPSFNSRLLSRKKLALKLLTINMVKWILNF